MCGAVERALAMGPRSRYVVDAVFAQRFDDEVTVKDRQQPLTIEVGVRDAALIAIRRRKSRIVDPLAPAKARVARRPEGRIEQSPPREAARNRTDSRRDGRRRSMKESMSGKRAGEPLRAIRKRDFRIRGVVGDRYDDEARSAQGISVTPASCGEIEDGATGDCVQAFDEAFGQWMGSIHQNSFLERPKEC